MLNVVGWIAMPLRRACAINKLGEEELSVMVLSDTEVIDSFIDDMQPPTFTFAQPFCIY